MEKSWFVFELINFSYFEKFHHFSSFWTLNVPCISESCIEIKIKRDFYFHTPLWRLKKFYEGLKSFHKTFWGTTKKCENKNFSLIFSHRPGLGREELAHETHETRPINRYRHGQYFQEILCMIWKKGFLNPSIHALFNLPTCRNQPKINDLCFLIYLVFITRIRKSNYHLLKISRLGYIVILSKL